MGGKGMAQAVRGHVLLDPRLLGVPLDQNPNHFPRNTLTPHAQKQLASRTVFDQMRTTPVQIIPYCLAGMPADGNDTLLGTFPENPGKPSSGSIAFISRAQISDTLSPLPYINSNKARSLFPSGVFRSGGAKKGFDFFDRKTTGQRSTLLGVGHKLGEILPENPSPTMYFANIRTAESFRDKLATA